MRYLKQFEVEALPDGSEITVTFPQGATAELTLRHATDYCWPIAVNEHDLMVTELIWCDKITRVMLTADARKLEKARQEAKE